jgi:uncharacterized membrane protein YhaH (DUF805 family)
MRIYVSKNGQNLGGFELTEVNQMLQNGQISPSDLAWQEGTPDWVSVRTIIGVITSPPPLPSQPPALKKTIGTNPFLWFTYSLKNYANFKGRARRREWWSFWFLYNIPFIPIAFLSGIINSSELSAIQSIFLILISLFTIFYALAMFIPLLSVSTRRMHDIGLSGWWWLLILIPCIGSLLALIIPFVAGQKHTNKYGDSPDK